MSHEGKNDNESLSRELFALQSKENGGRGINCARDIAMYWKMGDLESARSIAWNDNDKLRNYPNIQQFLEDNLFGPDVDSPLKLATRIKRCDEAKDS